MTVCPDIYTLERFVESKLPAEESTSVGTHVDECADCSDLIVQLRDDAAMRASIQRILPKSSSPHVPQIDGIVVEQEIGRGGQGVVWKGRQESTGRTVAVKLLSSTFFTQPIHRTRFLREVEIAASLRHPNIVSVFDGGETPSGELFMAMEWIDGERIDTWAREPGRSIDQLVDAFRKVADGVRHAHRQGVLHRDLKPGNIILAKDGTPRVLDFGLAKRLGDLDETVATRTGEFVGTVQFAAPEQLARRRATDEVDLLTDIHALGAILYAMLTGRPPYFVEGNLHATIQAVVDDDPPRASKIRSDVDADLDAVIVKALAKRREDRYASIDELLDDLDRRERGEVLHARRGERRHVVVRTIRRYWLPLTIVAMIVVILAAATIISWRFWRDSEIARSATASALQKRDAEARRSEDVVESFKLALRSASPNGSSANFTLSAFAENWSKSLDRKAPGLPETEFAMRVALAEVFRSLDRSGDSEREVRRALAIAASSKDVAPVDILDAELTLIEALYAQRKLPEWRTRLADVRKRAAGIVEPPTETATNLRVFGVLELLNDGKAAEALESTRKILADLFADARGPHGLTLHVMSLEVMILTKTGRLEEAVDAAKRIIAHRKKRSDLADAESIHTMVTLADLYRVLGRTKEAESTITEAIALARPIMRPTQTSFMHALVTYAMILVDVGDIEEAGVVLEDFPKADEEERYPDSGSASLAYRVISVAHRRAGRFEEAARAAEKGARRLDDAPLASIGQILEAYRYWTAELESQSRKDEAYRAQLLAVARLEKVQPTPVADITDARITAAEIAYRADLIAESIAVYRTILAAAPGDTAPSPRVSRSSVLERLAHVLDEDDQVAEAKKIRDEAQRLKAIEKP